MAHTRRLNHLQLRIQDKTGEINRVQRARQRAEVLRTPRMLAYISTLTIPAAKSQSKRRAPKAV